MGPLLFAKKLRVLGSGWVVAYMLMGFLCPPQSPFGFRTSWDLVRVGQFSFVVDCNLLKV